MATSTIPPLFLSGLGGHEYYNVLLIFPTIIAAAAAVVSGTRHIVLRGGKVWDARADRLRRREGEGCVETTPELQGGSEHRGR